jgi:hypothetical protein
MAYISVSLPPNPVSALQRDRPWAVRWGVIQQRREAPATP